MANILAGATAEPGNAAPLVSAGSPLRMLPQRSRDRDNLGDVLKHTCLYYDLFFPFSRLVALLVSFGYGPVILVLTAESMIASKENPVFPLVTVSEVFAGCYFRREGVHNTVCRTVKSCRLCDSPTIAASAFPFRQFSPRGSALVTRSRSCFRHLTTTAKFALNSKAVGKTSSRDRWTTRVISTNIICIQLFIAESSRVRSFHEAPH